MEPDVEKAKGKGGKKRRRSLRAYQNMSQPVNPEAAALIDRFPADDDDQPESSRKGTGNPVGQPGGRPVTDRLSPSRAAGQGASSSGDHNTAAWQDPMSGDGPRSQFLRHPLARGHADLQQSTTSPFPMGMMQTFNGDNMGDRDITLGGGRVNFQRLDAAAASGLSSPPGNPASRPMPHTAPIGQDNGGHSLSQPESRHPMSMKNSDRLAGFKRALFPGSGGAR